MNKVMLIGRLGRDPELRYTQSGAPVCSMAVATDESYKDRDGNKVDKAEWHRVNAFQRTAENCASYLSKGSLVYVEGSLQTRKYTDRDGVERSVTEIKAQTVQFLEYRKDREGGQQQASRGGQQGSRQQATRQQQYSQQPAQPSEMDEVPF